MSRGRRTTLIIVMLGFAAICARDRLTSLPIAHEVASRLKGRKTVADRLAQYGAAARARLAPSFAGANLSYPPDRVTLAYFKHERRLDVFASAVNAPLRFLRSYPSTAASGKLGPKLREGDRQVPEGLYRIVFMHPNSRFHLSLRIGYPNQYDIARGREDGRKDLGGDIMIHGSYGSVGCIAMGDEVAEDLFVVVADTGMNKVSVILSPVDFRIAPLPLNFVQPVPWCGDLYDTIKSSLATLPTPG